MRCTTVVVLAWRSRGAELGGVAIGDLEHIATCMNSSSKALIEVTRLKSRDEYTFLHSIAVSALMVHLVRAVGPNEETAYDVGMGGLHDIGKVRIPLKVLNKTGPLDEREMRLIRLHPSHGYPLLARQRDVSSVVLDICLHHHERIDGRGYQMAFPAKEITIPVRISSICALYDALTSVRAYKQAWSPRDAARFILEQKGQFDRRLVIQFFHSLDI